MDVALVGADGVPRQGALSGEVTAELRQRRAQRGGQALGLVIRMIGAIRVIRAGRALEVREAIPAVPPRHCSHGQSVHPGRLIVNCPGQVLPADPAGRTWESSQDLD